MEDNKDNRWLCQPKGSSLQETIEVLVGTDYGPNCLDCFFKRAGTTDEDAIANAQALVECLKNHPKGRSIRYLDLQLEGNEGESLPAKAQSILGDFLASPSCRLEKVAMSCTKGGMGTDILRVLAKYLPNGNTPITKIVFSGLSFKSVECRALLRELLVGKQDFEFIHFKCCTFDPQCNDVSFLVDGLKDQKHMTYFRCGWAKHCDSEKWSKVLSQAIAQPSQKVLSELEVYFPCPDSSGGDGMASLPQGLCDVLELPGSRVRRLCLPKFLQGGTQLPRMTEIVKQKCQHQFSQLCGILQKTNLALHEIKFNDEGSFVTHATHAKEDLDMFCQRNKLHTKIQELFENTPTREMFLQELANLKVQPDSIGLLPIYAMVRGEPDLASNSFLQSFAESLTPKR